MNNKMVTFGLLCVAFLGVAESQCAWACFGGKLNKVVPVDQAINKLVAKSHKAGGLGKRDFRKLQNWVGQLELDEDYQRVVVNLYPNVAIKSIKSKAKKQDGSLVVGAESRAGRYVEMTTSQKSYVFATPGTRYLPAKSMAVLTIVDQQGLEAIEDWCNALPKLTDEDQMESLSVLSLLGSVDFYKG